MFTGKNKFEKLTPNDNIDLKIYEDAINYVFDNNDIKNVAISGAYSAGKSSVLESYKKKHNNLKFLHISLAHFNLQDKEKQTDIKESVLEGKILNQLMHQIQSDKIIQTNFKIKQTVKRRSIISETLKIIIFLFSIIYMVNFELWKQFVINLSDSLIKSILILSTSSYFQIIMGFVISVILFMLIYDLIKLQKNKNIFKKLNIKGNEIEIFEESNDSYFDRYLNEVLYLFENSDADVIVFEDMDRYNANEIFERLREINTLVNIKLKKENSTCINKILKRINIGLLNKIYKKKYIIRFFYLLRDDIFISKDRTKFFDFIIPIVPVIDSSNSYDKFYDILRESKLLDKFDRNFLQGLSLYIDDMRILKNIYNEFLIYYNKLDTTELNCNKMLAIITYKNIFPRDFNNLQLNQGFVHTLFNSKDQFIKCEINKINELIQENQNRITECDNENLNDVRELDILYAIKYYRYSGCSIYNESNQELSDLLKKELRGNDVEEYRNRKKIIDDKINSKKVNLEREIKKLKQQIFKIKNKQLSQIVTRDNIDEIFNINSINDIGEKNEFKEIKGSEYFPLLKYLIRNGFIDETYSDYMTYFYEKSISRVDKIFLRSIADKKAKDYIYKLKNPELVVSYLSISDFEQEEILNFDLFEFLLNDEKYYPYLKRFIEQLKDTKNFKFISEFLNTKNYNPNFFKNCNSIWSELFITACSEETLTDEQMHVYLINSIYYCDNLILETVNIENCLKEYISNKADFLNIDNPKIEKLIDGFTFLKVCFVAFDYGKVNKKLFNEIYNNSLYEINKENLELIQREVLGINDVDYIKHKNYTIILSHSESPIAKYISKHINEYIEVIIEMSNGYIQDDENVAIELLNNPDIDIDNKKLYICNLKTIIDNIDKIKDKSLWPELLEYDTIKFSEENIINYFDNFRLDVNLINFINKYNNSIDFSTIDCDNEKKEMLFDNIITCNDIENMKYAQILCSLEYTYNDFDVKGISNEKLRILIDKNIITMNENNLIFIRDNYKNIIFDFIKKYIKEYVDIIDKDLISTDELLEILEWDISDEFKIELLKNTNDEISIIDRNYSVKVYMHIIDNNFMDSDLDELLKSFDEWDQNIKEKIVYLSLNDMQHVINNIDKVSINLLDTLIHSNDLSRNYKIDILTKIISRINNEHLIQLLNLLNLNNYIKLFNRKSRPKFYINSENEKLLTAFKNNNIISDFEKNLENNELYKVRKKSLKI